MYNSSQILHAAPDGAEPLHAERIVFFDGVCNLCNGAVTWLIDHDAHNRLRFAPLQGETFASLNQQGFVPSNLSTIVFWSEGRFSTHSEAVVRTCAALGGAWRMVLGGLIVPAFLRDSLYRYISRNRYAWFGKSDVCRFPTPELNAKFLP